MLFSIWNCFAVSATEVPYPPLESGHYGAKIYFNPYSFETTDNEPISFDDACMLQMDKFNNPATLSGESVENQIKEDYFANVDNNANIEKMEINHYGTLSDGRISITDVTCIQKYIAGGYGNTGRTGIVPLVVG